MDRLYSTLPFWLMLLNEVGDCGVHCWRLEAESIFVTKRYKVTVLL